MERKLYVSKTEWLYMDIIVSISDSGAMCISGCDIGKIVKDIRGESSYEYQRDVDAEGVKTLMQKLSVSEGISINFEALLDWLATNYNDKNAFKDIAELLEKHGIESRFSVWG